MVGCGHAAAGRYFTAPELKGAARPLAATGSKASDIVARVRQSDLSRDVGRFGPAPDVDGDGRFTVLLSSWLDHLGGGRFAVDGLVRVADLDRAFRPPLGNQCDVMYLSASLESGPYLRTVLAHEYMHAVLFGQKGRGGHGARAPVQEEEGWLDEAIAHLAEDCCGFSTSNIDYRVRAFLARPERYQLVVDDYYAADLFRSHGNRGSTYLFLRWCADRYGPGCYRLWLPRGLRSGQPRGMHRRRLCRTLPRMDARSGWSMARGSEERAGGSTEQPLIQKTASARGLGARRPATGAPRSVRGIAGGAGHDQPLCDRGRFDNRGQSRSRSAARPRRSLQVTAVLLGDDRPAARTVGREDSRRTGELISEAHQGAAWSAGRARGDLVGTAFSRTEPARSAVFAADWSETAAKEPWERQAGGDGAS